MVSSMTFSQSLRVSWAILLWARSRESVSALLLHPVNAQAAECPLSGLLLSIDIPRSREPAQKQSGTHMHDIKTGVELLE